MAIQLFLDLNELNYYGDIPEIPDNPVGRVEEFALSMEDIELFKGDIDAIDSACNALLDIGDVDYFNSEKCEKLKTWIAERLKKDSPPRYREILEEINGYCERAISLNTGVVIEL